MITIEYFGHASFRIITENNMHFVFDPGIYNENKLVPEDTKTDFICVTHIHQDHYGNCVELAKKQKALLFGNSSVIQKAKKEGIYPWLIRELGNNMTYKIEEFTLAGYSIRHGPVSIEKQPENTSFMLTVEDTNIVHLGDAIGIGPYERFKIDVLFMPIDETEALKPQEALNAANVLKPRVIIPMHYKSDDDVEYFVKNLKYFSSTSTAIVLRPKQKVTCFWHVGHEFICQAED